MKGRRVLPSLISFYHQSFTGLRRDGPNLNLLGSVVQRMERDIQRINTIKTY